MKWLRLAPSLLGLISSFGYGAQSHTKFFGLVTYNNHYRKLLYMVEPQIRFIDRTGTYEQSLLNAGAGMRVTPQLQLWLGQTLTNYSDTNNIEEDVGAQVLNEYRIWEQIWWNSADPYGNALALRSRLEQRRGFETAEWGVRLRERGYWTLPLTASNSFVLSDEVFINLKAVPWVQTSTFDQNRFFVGILHQLSSEISANLSYMNQYITRTPRANDHVIVVNVFMTMD